MREARLYEQPSWLYQRYWVEKLSVKKLGTLCNVKACTIRRHMKKNNIPSRTESKASEECYGVSPYRNKKRLSKMYWKQNYTLREIAVVCGRDRTTVRDWFRKFDIPVRSRGEWRTKEKRHRSLISKFLSGTKRIAKSLNDYLGVQNTRDN